MILAIWDEYEVKSAKGLTWVPDMETSPEVGISFKGLFHGVGTSYH